ncbi:MAG: alanine racemase [bacterium]
MNYLNWIELSSKALGNNIASLSKLAGKRILAVCVKSNAYGHGLPEIVGDLIYNSKVEYLTVHSIEEAIKCRAAGWQRSIVILGPVHPSELKEVIEHHLEPVIFDRQSLTSLGKLGDKYKKKIKTHLKLETGTNRQGLQERELPEIAEIYKKYKSLGKPYGVSTHFANIEDTTNHKYAEEQLALFNHLVKKLNELKIPPSIRHTACSAALILFDKTRFEMVRPGISAYGHWSSKETYLSYRLSGGDNSLFNPVLSWRCRITQIKNVEADSFIGYGCTYRTTTPSRLAVLPVGYADGYDRGLSNRSYVLIKGKRAPIRGRVCMNLMMADITDIKGVKLHDQVTLIGCDGTEEIKAEDMAGWAGTIAYEILARISPIIPRIVIK